MPCLRNYPSLVLGLKYLSAHIIKITVCLSIFDTTVMYHTGLCYVTWVSRRVEFISLELSLIEK